MGADLPNRPHRLPEDNALQLQDPRAIRALAHPARMVIIDALASGDELTATDCAALTGLSPSATAYHLKLLARYDLAEPAAARSDGRERPWRATERQTRFDLDPSTAAGAAAATAVALAYFDRTRAVGEEFMASAHQETHQWQDAASLTNADLWLTAQEAQQLTIALDAATAAYRSRTLTDHPEGSRRVRVMNLLVPHHQR